MCSFCDVEEKVQTAVHKVQIYSSVDIVLRVAEGIDGSRRILIQSPLLKVCGSQPCE